MSRSAAPAVTAAAACRIARFGLVVADADMAERFFAEAFGGVTVARSAGDSAFADLVGLPGAMTRQTHLRLGDQELVLIAFDPPGRPYPPGSTSSDLWFQHLAIIVADMDAAQARVRAAGHIMPITEGGPVRLPCASGGVRAWKFRDADGHPLELLQFRPGAVPGAWRARSGGGVFLGIDHSAIAVSDTSRSIGFFQASFGLMAAMRTENVGAEQMRLDAVNGARVMVASLNPDHPLPHLELLGYEAGRRRPIVMAASSDIAATHVVLQTQNLALIVDALVAAGARFVSPGVCTLSDGTRAVMVLDPDGHRFLIEEDHGVGAAESWR